MILKEFYLDAPKMQAVIDAFSDCTDIPITVFDENGKFITESLAEKKICNCFKSYNTAMCATILDFSSQIAKNLGEPYIFNCAAGFVNISVAILIGDEYKGCLIAGPMAMGAITNENIKQMLTMNLNTPGLLYEVDDFLKSMKIYNPMHINKLSLLLYNNVLSLYDNKVDYEKINAQYKRQVDIAQKLHQYKKNNATISYPYDKEKELIKKVKKGDAQGSKELLTQLLNEILLVEAGNFEIIKARVLELIVILSRASVEGGASLNRVLGLNFDLLNDLNNIKTINELCGFTANVTDHFAQNVFDTIYSGQSYIISQAIQHINANYMNRISLKKVANYIHVNESYLSKLFKQEMSISFTEYLNEIRINKSIELMENTRMNILDIALYVGFEDQSYFTKVFKKRTGRTPKKYRSTELIQE